MFIIAFKSFENPEISADHWNYATSNQVKWVTI